MGGYHRYIQYVSTMREGATTKSIIEQVVAHSLIPPWQNYVLPLPAAAESVRDFYYYLNPTDVL